jgi:preprotein translocase subunit Sec63
MLQLRYVPRLLAARARGACAPLLRPLSSSSSSSSSAEPSFYAILGVPRDAPLEDIKAAFRRQAKLHHPDALAGISAAGSSAAEQEPGDAFKALSAAYTVLSDAGE